MWIMWLLMRLNKNVTTISVILQFLDIYTHRQIYNLSTQSCRVYIPIVYRSYAHVNRIILLHLIHSSFLSLFSASSGSAPFSFVIQTSVHFQQYLWFKSREAYIQESQSFIFQIRIGQSNHFIKEDTEKLISFTHKQVATTNN